MNKFIVICMVAVCTLEFAVAIFDRENMMEVGTKCKEESEINEDDLKKIMNKEMPESKEGKCMMACIFKKIGLMTDDGKYDEAGNIKTAEETFSGNAEKLKQAKQLGAMCKEQVNAVNDDESGCERAAEMHKCALEKAKEMGYIM